MPTNPCKPLMPHESLTPKRTPYRLGPLTLCGSLNANVLLNPNGLLKPLGSLRPHSSQNPNGPLNPPWSPMGLWSYASPWSPLIPWIIMGTWSPVGLLKPFVSLNSKLASESPWAPEAAWVPEAPLAPILILTIPPLALMLDPWESFVKYVHFNIEWTSVFILAKIKNFNEVCSKKDLFSCHKKWQITQDHSRWAWNLRKISLYGHGTNSR